jgi:hypothetical protein
MVRDSNDDDLRALHSVYQRVRDAIDAHTTHIDFYQPSNTRVLGQQRLCLDDFFLKSASGIQTPTAVPSDGIPEFGCCNREVADFHLSPNSSAMRACIVLASTVSISPHR